MTPPHITILGTFVADLAFRADRLPAWGETVMGTEFRMGPGGKGSNQAVAAARLGARVILAASAALLLVSPPLASGQTPSTGAARGDTVAALIAGAREAYRASIGFVTPSDSKSAQARAVKLVHQALAIASARGDLPAQVDVLFEIAAYARQDSAVVYLKRAIDIARASNDSSRLLDAESRMANAFDALGMKDSARTIHARLIASARSREDRTRLAYELVELAAVEQHTRPDTAILLSTEAIGLFSLLGDTVRAQTAALIIANAASFAGHELRRSDTRAALPYFQLAEKMALTTPLFSAPHDSALANAYLALSMRDSAIAVYTNLLRLKMSSSRSEGIPFELEPILQQLISLEDGFSKPAILLEHLRILNAAQTAAGNGDRLPTLRRLAATFDTLGVADSAETYLVQSATLATARGQSAVQWREYASLANRFAKTQRPDSGVTFMRAAARAYWKDTPSAAECREAPAMLLNILTMYRHGAAKTDTATLASIIGIADVIDAASLIREHAGSGEVELLEPDTGRMDRRAALLASASLAALRGSTADILASIGARERLLGDSVSIAAVFPTRRQFYCSGLLDTSGDMTSYALGSTITTPASDAITVLAYAFSDDTLFAWLPDTARSSWRPLLVRTPLARARLAKLTAATDAASLNELAALLIPAPFEPALKGNHILIALCPELERVDFAALPLAASGSRLGTGRTLSIDRSLAKLVLALNNK